MKWRLALYALFVLGLVAVGSVGYTLGSGVPVAKAAPGSCAPPFPIFGRCDAFDYWTNTFTHLEGSWMYEHGMRPGTENPWWVPGDPNIVDANSFISQIQTDLYRDFSACVPRDGVLTGTQMAPNCQFQKKRAQYAAFLILTMLGHPGTDPLLGGNIVSGVAYAKTQFALWSSFVQQYASGVIPGASVNWNVMYPFGQGTVINSLISGNGTEAIITTFANEGTLSSIVFRHPDGTTYIIKLMCGNATGSLAPFPDFIVEGGIRSGVGTPLPGGAIIQGPQYQVDSYAYWAGGALPPPPGVITLTVPPQVTPNLTTLAGYGGVWNPATRTVTYGNLNLGLVSPGPGNAAHRFLDWTLNAGVPDQTIVTFSAVVSPSNRSGGSAGPYTISYEAVSPRYPQVIGSSGDVHAGGGLCGQAQTTGNVTGHSSSASLTEYVLSANGTINNFGSNNVAGGTTASLGRTGNYYSICRPDLAAVAQSYFQAGQPYTALPGGNFDLASLPASPTGIYIHNGGGNISLHGTFNRKITIVSFTGTVTINGNIILDGPANAGSNVPSLGIISAGDIIINGAATRVDAYLFSNGTINTCAQGNVAACRNILTVNGFLMSRNLSFRRLGVALGPIINPAERINLTGQIYLNPPKFFDVAADLNLLQNQGEKPPLN